MYNGIKKLCISSFEDSSIFLHSWTKFSVSKVNNFKGYVTILQKVSMKGNNVLFLRA